MSDLLRAAGTVPEFRRALRLCLVEASPVLRAEQERRLRQAQPAWVSACRRAAGRPDADRGQRVPRRAADPAVRPRSRRLVGANGGSRSRGSPGLCRRSAKPCGEPAGARQPATKLARHDRGDLPGRPRLGGRARFSIGPPTGCGTVHRLRLFPDCPGPTLRALQHHRPVCALAAPGTADLSAHVDFAALGEAARAAGAEVHGPISQGRFLDRARRRPATRGTERAGHARATAVTRKRGKAFAGSWRDG